MINLEGKTALLTASGQGIGKATAEDCVKAGAYVIATDINEESLEKLYMKLINLMLQIKMQLKI